MMVIGETWVQLSLVLVLACSGCERATSEPSTSPGEPGGASIGEPTELGEQAPLVPGTRIRMHAPSGAQRGNGFLGYAWSDGASIVVMELPGPFLEIATGFSADGLASQGMTLLSREQVDVGGREAVMLQVAQEANGIRYHKWLLLLGDEAATVIINAIYPEALAARFADPFRGALLGASWDPTVVIDPRDEMDWTIDPPRGLQLAYGPMGGLLFTQSGEQTPDDHGAPLYIAVPSMGWIVVEDLQTQAEAQAYDVVEVRELAIELSQPFTAAIVEGWEIVARAKDLETGIDLKVHQVMLMTESGYVRLVGMVRAADAEEWLVRFREAAASWKPR